MRTRSTLFIAVLLTPFVSGAQSNNNSVALTPVAGKWEGESLCLVSDSPCKNEHVLYEIVYDRLANETSAGPKPFRDWRLDAYKIVNGQKQSMGSLHCSFDEKKKNLSCLSQLSTELDWEFFVDGDSMQGTLAIGAEKTLFRKVSAKRVSKN